MTPPDLAALRARCAAPLPHPDPDEMRRSAEAVLGHAVDDYAGLPGRPLGRSASREELERRLSRPPGEEGRPFAEVLEDFRRDVAPFAFRPHHPRFLAFVPGALGAPDRGSATAETGEAAPAAAGRGGAGRALLKLTGRYALLALLAYVMIARLRLHPVGLIVGASSLVASASLEAVRVLTRASR